MIETLEILTREERSDQTFSAISMLNRLSVAEIKLKRSERKGNAIGSEANAIRSSIHSLTDSILLGENVRLSLKDIDKRIAHFEQIVATQ